MARKAIEPDFSVGDIIADLIEEFGPPVTQVKLDPNNCYTTEELSVIFGKSENTIRKKLKRHRRENRLIETTKLVEILGRPGTFVDVPAYQIRRGDKGNEED